MVTAVLHNNDNNENKYVRSVSTKTELGGKAPFFPSSALNGDVGGEPPTYTNRGDTVSPLSPTTTHLTSPAQSKHNEKSVELYMAENDIHILYIPNSKRFFQAKILSLNHSRTDDDEVLDLMGNS